MFGPCDSQVKKKRLRGSRRRFKLPIAGLERTGLVLDRFSIPDRPKPVSERQKRLQRHFERQREIMEGPSSAAKALKTALSWQSLINEEGINRAEIARREGLTRSRVTQVMSLLDLSDTLKRKLLDNEPETRGWSVRQAIAQVDR